MYQRIMVPLDGSGFAESALPFALSVSRKSGGDVELVTVQETATSYTFGEWEAAARRWAESYLDETAERVRKVAAGAVTTTVLEGDVPGTLVRHASDSGSNLVVMATHGRGVLSRAWLGSVADAFVRHTDRPVLLAHPMGDLERPDPAEEKSLDRVLVPLDGTELSESILEPAIQLGSLFDARYTLLRVVTLPTEIAPLYLSDPIQLNRELVAEAQESARAGVESVAAKLRGRGLTADGEVVVNGQPAHAILRRAEQLDSRLIALATHGRGGLARVVLGSTTDKVIRSASRPVLVLKPLSAD